MVFVLDTHRRPLDPCVPARARLLLKQGKAAVSRQFPFTIILNERTLEESVVHEHRLKIDPGSRITGIAILQEEKVVFPAELTHRGQKICSAMTDRRMFRKSRRSRKTRYRKPRFLNRTRPAGWLPPSLMHRVETTETWVRRLMKLCPVAAISVETVLFDVQLMENPNISGVEYQQGTLAGYEIREYLLEKYERTCVYCEASGVRLQIEHVVPRSKGGSNRISNLVISCVPCNVKKGTLPIEVFLADRPEVLARIQAQLGTPHPDAAAVNATRNLLLDRLHAFGLPVEVGTGGRTKCNRTRARLAKSHWADAATVGESTPGHLEVRTDQVLSITSNGHGKRRVFDNDKFGFPSRQRSAARVHFGFQTGDIVRAVVPSGKKAGRHTGRVLTRRTGSFDVRTPMGRVAGISHQHCSLLHRKDGYSYAHHNPRIPPPG